MRKGVINCLKFAINKMNIDNIRIPVKNKEFIDGAIKTVDKLLEYILYIINIKQFKDK